MDIHLTKLCLIFGFSMKGIKCWESSFFFGEKKLCLRCCMINRMSFFIKTIKTNFSLFFTYENVHKSNVQNIVENTLEYLSPPYIGD